MGDLVTKEALRLLYFDAALWVYTSAAVQRQVLESLHRHITHRPSVLSLPDMLPLLSLLSLVRRAYWSKPQGRHALGVQPLVERGSRRVIGVRPNAEEVGRLRKQVLGMSVLVLR